MRRLLKIIRFINNHPLTRDEKGKALLRFVRWQFISRLFPFPFIYPFIENTKLIIKKGMTGATGNVYVGLHDFEDMAFLLHFLRGSDVFGDIGANIGTYTILASGVVKAKTIAAEPVPGTFKHLQNNIKINEAEDLVSAINMGLGAIEGEMRFTKNYDTVNHVVKENTYSKDETIQVHVVTLDQLFFNNHPALLKIDVEGFELNVLKGGPNILKSDDLKAIIIELNGSGTRYNTGDAEVHNLLLSAGFLPYLYHPFKRQLVSITQLTGRVNTIYIRDRSFVENRVVYSRSYSLLGKKF